MNETLIVNKNDACNRYDISLNTDFVKLRDYFSDFFEKKYAKICIVTDDKVANFYLDEVKSVLSPLDSKIFSHIFPSGEASKNCNTLNKLYEDLIINHFDRNDLLIALGGGVVGDLTGYCAATYLRGIDYIQVPTTLLSQVDSSIGGKTAIDFMQYKNMVGAFYMPKLVYINVNTLKTLDKAQFDSGMGEIIKHGLIQDRGYYDFIDDNKADIAKFRPETLIELILRSCAIKSRVVEIDPKEKGIRAYLNFGHTIGHAIEKLSDYKLYHGQCVAIGMVSALYISCKLGGISKDEMDKVIKLIEYFDLPTCVEGSEYDAQTILETTKSDKKMENNTIKFVVLNSIGEAEINKEIDDNLLLEAINYIIK